MFHFDGIRRLEAELPYAVLIEHELTAAVGRPCEKVERSLLVLHEIGLDEFRCGVVFVLDEDVLQVVDVGLPDLFGVFGGNLREDVGTQLLGYIALVVFLIAENLLRAIDVECQV